MVFSLLKESISENEAKYLILSEDRDRDGKLNYNEFSNLILWFYSYFFFLWILYGIQFYSTRKDII